MPYLIGVDLGTSACKVAIFMANGEKVSEAQKEYPIYHPQLGWAEQRPLEWWNAAVETIKESLKRANISENDIAGLAVDSQREAVVPVGKKGEELYNSIIWMDNRTGAQVNKIKRLVSQENVLSVTGAGIDPIFSASKILWLKENVPQVFDETAYFLCAKDYIVYKLSGEIVTDYSMASRTMVFDIRKRVWSEEICSTVGIPVDKLPPAREATTVVGEVSSQASEKTLLPRGLPIVNGGGDRPCECLGSGVTRQGLANIGTGTGSLIEVPLEAPAIDVQGRIPCCCHVIPNMWEYEVQVATTGGSLRWFRDTFGFEEKVEASKTRRDPYDLLTESALRIDLGSDGLFFYPHLTGAYVPNFNEKARAVYFGITLSHTKGHFVRAILEGVAFKYLEAFGLLDGLNASVEAVNMVGGETRSGLWNQIKADVLGRIISIPKVDNTAVLGAALLAGTGTGHYSDLQKAAEEVVEIENIYKPNLGLRQRYLRIYRDYARVYSFIEKGYEIF